MFRTQSTPDFSVAEHNGLRQGCGSGSGLDPGSVTLWIRIRIGNPDPEARKRRNFNGKMHFLVICFKKITEHFLKKFLMNKTGIFYLI
jgi:hypothetical protein